MKKFHFLLILFINHLGWSQQDPLAKNAFLGGDIQQGFDFWNISEPNLKFHSSMRPYIGNSFVNANDSALPFKFYGFNNSFFSKTFSKNTENKKKLNIQAHPLLDIEPGYDFLSKRSVNSALAGTHFKVNYGNNFTFAASIFGGKTDFPFFLDTAVSQHRIIPEYGQGYRANRNGYSFFDYTGYLSYTTNNKVFNFQAGRDKHFIGDGYRSVLLSDFAPANPYFKITANVWRLQYSVWYSWMNDVTNAGGLKQNFSNKYGTFHYLSYNVVKEFNIGFFENVIWRGTDTNQVRTFEVNYLNPIIFFRPQEYSLGSPDNSFIGANMNATLFKRLKLYAQIGLDEFFLREIRARNGWWANKQAWQMGFKYINAFGLKGLKVQVEYNQVRPFTYTHGLVDQNYGHYGMPLAHPFGANFKEYQVLLNYRKDKWAVSWQLMYVQIGKDTSATAANMGQNIFRSYITRPYEYGHFTGQGDKHNIIQSHLKVTYFLKPELNMRLELGYIQRSETSSRNYILENPYIYFGFKTSFWNVYRDF